MKLLFVTQYFWPEGFRVNDLAVELVRRGHEVTVLTGLPNYPSGSFFPGYGPRGPWTERHEGIRVVRAPLVPRGRAGNARLAVNYLSFAVAASALAPLRCRGPYDAAFAFQGSPVTSALPALLLEALRGHPYVVWVQDLWPASLTAARAVSSPLVLRPIAAFVSLLYRRAARVLVASRGFEAPVEALGAARERIAYVPNWAELFYKPSPPELDARARLGLPSGFLVLFAGNLGAAQSLETLLDAAERLRDETAVRFAFVGAGARRASLEEAVRARGLGSSVALLPSRPPEEMPDLLASADALLVSLRPDPLFAATVPSKLQSCLASGRPLLASLDGEGARLVAASGAGLVSAAGDADALAANVLALRGLTEEERCAMGLRGRALLESEFDRTRLIDRIEDALEAAAAGRPADS